MINSILTELYITLWLKWVASGKRGLWFYSYRTVICTLTVFKDLRRKNKRLIINHLKLMFSR